MNSNHFRKRASALIQRYSEGNTCSITVPGKATGGTPANPTYSPPQTFYGIPVVYDTPMFSYRPETLVPNAKTVAYMSALDLEKAGVVGLSNDMVITQDGNELSILRHEVIAPSTNPILYILQLAE